MMLKDLPTPHFFSNKDIEIEIRTTADNKQKFPNIMFKADQSPQYVALYKAKIL